MARYRIEVRGVVQGVGFRWFTSRAAKRHGLVGFVSNHADGSVRCEAEGAAATLAQFLAELRQGPAGSRVDAVHWQEVAECGGEAFALRR